MIERFNFYDIYGYVVPGIVLLALLWLPYGLAGEHAPSIELSKAAVIVVLAYVVGHLLQTISWRHVISYPLPSEKLLTSKDSSFAKEELERLFNCLHEQFPFLPLKELEQKRPLADMTGHKGKKHAEERDKEEHELPKCRREAYQLCRAALVQKQAAKYAEQFQGMYAMMHNLMAATILGGTYHVGWGLACVFRQSIHSNWCELVWIGFAAVILIATLEFVGRMAGSDRPTSEIAKPPRSSVSTRFAWVLRSAVLVMIVGCRIFESSRGWWLAVLLGAVVALTLLSAMELFDWTDYAPSKHSWLPLVALVMVPLGATLGQCFGTESLSRGWLFGIGLICLPIAYRFYSAFRLFADYHAAAVFREYLVFFGSKSLATAASNASSGSPEK